MLALGIIAVMLALGMFSSSTKVGAAAVPIDHVVNTAVNSPNTPGSNATYTIKFQNASELTAGSGQLFVKFDSLIDVPASIEKERITISASGGGTSNPLFDPTVTTDAAGDSVVTITVGDTDPGTAGTQNLTAWDANGDTTNTNLGHILQFSALAGIKNSSFPAANAAWVDMSDDGVTYNSTPQEIPVFRHLALSLGGGPRGSSVTVSGKGFVSGGTATVFLDADGGFDLDSGEVVLSTSDAAISGGAFSSTFTVDTNFAVGANSINVIDGTGASANAPAQGARFESQTFTLSGAVALSSASATRGGAVTVTVSDFANSPISQITIGGVQADLTGLTLTIANNTASVGVTVPSTTPLGTQLVAVTGSGEGLVAGVPTARTANLVVGGLTLNASPSTVVANQAVTVSGSGFTASGTIADNGITVGSIIQPLLTSGSAETTVTMDNSGNLVASFLIPNDETTRTPGNHVLSITDSGNRIGETTITVPSRTLTLDPASSKRGSTVSYTGGGYIASTTVTVAYGGATVDTITADASGNISGSFTVPTGSGIPSANGVVATSTCTCTGSNIAINLTGAATHSVPGATVTADPGSAASGETVEVSGTGFPGFVGVSAFTIGSVSALSGAANTDGDGAFSLNALVPELSAGSHSLVITVGTGTTGVTATSSFTVNAAVATPVVTSTATETTFADEIAADNLVRVWWYDNATQGWSFFDPRPAFAAENTYTAASSDDIVWVNVTADTSFEGSDLFAGWNLISLD
jgi:hypothetical protein